MRRVAWVFAVAIAIALGAPKAGQASALCSKPVQHFQETCDLYQAYCHAFLGDTASLDRSTLEPIPASAKQHVAGTSLSRDVLGFRRTPSDFEPRSRKKLDRAFAAVFLAAKRPDGRVTEITLNWNLAAPGLTRLSVSNQPERPHTSRLLSKGSE